MFPAGLLQRTIINRQNRFQKHARAIRHVLRRCKFLRRMADAVYTGYEDHAGRRNVRHVLGIVAGAARHQLETHAQIIGSRRDDAPHLPVGRCRWRCHVDFRESNRCEAGTGDAFRFLLYALEYLLNLPGIEITNLETQNNLAGNYVRGTRFRTNPANGRYLPAGHGARHMIDG